MSKTIPRSIVLEVTGMPQSIIGYQILIEYFCEFQSKIALLQSFTSKHQDYTIISNLFSKHGPSWMMVNHFLAWLHTWVKSKHIPNTLCHTCSNWDVQYVLLLQQWVNIEKDHFVTSVEPIISFMLDLTYVNLEVATHNNSATALRHCCKGHLLRISLN